MRMFNVLIAHLGLCLLVTTVGCGGTTTPDQLVGQWQSGEGNASWSMTITSDGSMTMSAPEGSFNGTWQRNGDEFVMTVDGFEVKYNIDSLDENELAFTPLGGTMPGMEARSWSRVSNE